MSKCVLANRPCPETADASKPLYCPLWVDAVPEVVRDGSGRIVAEETFRGCFLRRLPLYLVSVTASAGQAAASADACRNRVEEQLEPVRVLVEMAERAMLGREATALPVPAEPRSLGDGDGP